VARVLQEASTISPRAVFSMLASDNNGGVSLWQLAELLSIFYDFQMVDSKRNATLQLRRLLADAYLRFTKATGEDRVSWEQVRVSDR
jgi:hypothetical protein